jgi:cysteine-rich repeat protein
VAIPLSAGTTMGDTSIVENAVISGCTGLTGPEEFYAFTPAEHGTLTVTLDNPALVASFLSDCENRTVAACGNFGAPLSTAVKPGVPVYVVVGGPVGSFDLMADFVPSCGDGVLDPWETCDDGNRTPGDGCDASCQVEPEFYCAAAKPLALGDNPDDTTGGASVFSAPCAGAGAPERLYTFTAPSKGVLVLDLASAADLGLYVLPSCAGASSASDGGTSDGGTSDGGTSDGGTSDGGTCAWGTCAWVTCVNDAHTGGTELASMTMQAGESFVIVVDGSTSADKGPFTLNAQFVPAP